MARPEVRALLRWGVAAALCAGAAPVAHAASLNGIDSQSIASFSYPADIQPVDTNPPTIVATVEPVPNTFGWNNTAVTVTFTCDDAESGVATCSGPATLSAEGADQVVIGEATDNAANEASVSVSVDIDLTAPTVVMSGVLPGASLPFVPPVTCTATDALSGVDGPCVVTFEYVGGFAFDAVGTARDFADNVTVVRVRFSVSAICAAPGVPDTTPCVVPPGYTIDADLEWNADVTVYGTVTGKIRVDDGTITVESGGVVEEHLDQRGPGSIVLQPGATVEGKVRESGDGDILIEAGAVVDGKIDERDQGSVTVRGTVNGRIHERGSGDVTIEAPADITADVIESDDGSLFILTTIGGNAEERDGGDLVVAASVTVNGDAVEKRNGNMSVGDDAHITGDAESDGQGTCTISPTATIDGRLKDACR